MKLVNILGDTQREQWHSVVNMLRVMGGDMTRKGRSDICDELDRYIDHAEDIFDEMRKEKEEPHAFNECTLKDMFTRPEIYEKTGDVDVCDDVFDDYFCAWCGTQLTEAGLEQFKDLLYLTVEVDRDVAIVKIDDDPKWETLHRRLRKLFNSAAGYCSEEEYDKWFKEESK